MSSPTQRTLKHYRDLGYKCQVVEHWNPFAKIRIDLFGFIDILAIKPDEIIGIQTTSDSGRSARRKKIQDSELAKDWVKAGGKIVLTTWGKKKVKRGGKAMRWQMYEEEITFSETQT